VGTGVCTYRLGVDCEINVREHPATTEHKEADPPMPATRKKIATLALAGVLVFGASACSDDDTPDDGTDITDAPVTTMMVDETVTTIAPAG